MARQASIRVPGTLGRPRMPPMPSRPIFLRVILVAELLAGLVALADGIVRQELQRATGDRASIPAAGAVQMTGAIR